jgi:L-ribulose-5-phosphate 4-epimerase
MKTKEYDSRKLIFDMAKRCYRDGILTMSNGNISVYDPESGIMTITPSSVHYEELELEDIVQMQLDGTKINGKRKPSSEWRMHSVVYSELKEVRAQIHTHSPYAASFSVNKMNIPVIMIEMAAVLGGSIKVADFAMPGTFDVGVNTVKALHERNACLLQNHGLLAVGENLVKAYERAVCLEEAAHIYSLALNNGDITVIPDEIAEKIRG